MDRMHPMPLLLDARLSPQFPCIRRSPIGFRSSFRAFVVPVDSVDPVDPVDLDAVVKEIKRLASRLACS